MIQLDRTQNMSCQSLMYVAYSPSIFLNILNEVLHKHAALKKKYLKANQGGFITK